MKNEEYFNKQCEILEYLLSRSDKEHSAIKTVIRCATREACNFATDLPGYDNKLGARLVSQKAYEQLSQGDKENLIGEHLVPISIILTKLNQLDSINTESISKIIRKYSTKAVITKEEDQRLRKNGLHKSMPDGWDEENIMSRYTTVGIEVIEISFGEVLKKHNDHIKLKKINSTPDNI